jgi:ATP adenylyltransferase
MEYIRGRKPAGCIFCHDEQTVNDRQKLILIGTTRSIVMLNRYPYSNGHLLVAPRKHIASLDQLSDEEMLDLLGLVKLSSKVLGDAASPQGFNIGINLGKAAGAGVEEHLHIHIVPRWNGDTNFMSVIADLRVMPENLLATYDVLLPGFQAG